MLSWITVSRGYPSTSAARLITSSPFSGKMATCRDKEMHSHKPLISGESVCCLAQDSQPSCSLTG